MTLILLPTVELEPSAWAEPGHDALIGTSAWDEFWGRSRAENLSRLLVGLAHE
jgi:hypothetical protein